MENYKEYFDNISYYSGLDLVKSDKRGYLKDQEKREKNKEDLWQNIHIMV